MHSWCREMIALYVLVLLCATQQGGSRAVEFVGRHPVIESCAEALEGWRRAVLTVQSALRRWDHLVDSTVRPAMRDMQLKLDDPKYDPKLVSALTSRVDNVKRKLRNIENISSDDFETVALNLEFLSSQVRTDPVSLLQLEVYTEMFAKELDRSYRAYKSAVDVSIENFNKAIREAVAGKRNAVVEDVLMMRDTLVADLHIERGKMDKPFEEYVETKNRAFQQLKLIKTKILMKEIK